MALRSKRIKTNLKTIAATATVLFSLFSLFSGTLAWFASNASAKATGMAVNVVVEGDGYEVEDVYLNKFNFEEEVHNGFTMIDYLSPEDGEAKRYLFDSEVHNQFGEVVDGNWQAVDTMNTYDPIEFIIHQNASLRDLNCNAIYEIHLSSSRYTQCMMAVNAFRLTDKTKTNNQIFLSDCLDFNVYTLEDLADGANGNFPNGNEYYPSYYARIDRALTADEIVYYKISYLASLTSQQFSPNTHAHFYGTQPKPDSVDITSNRAVEFVDNGGGENELVVYVNVNYSINQLRQYSTSIYQGTIKAIFDYAFNFTFTESQYEEHFDQSNDRDYQYRHARCVYGGFDFELVWWCRW